MITVLKTNKKEIGKQPGEGGVIVFKENKRAIWGSREK